MTVTAAQLLVRAAARFRSYEANHRSKAGVLEANGPGVTSAIAATLDKAAVNAAAAEEIEAFLAAYPEAVGSSDTFDRVDLMQLLRRAHDEVLNQRFRVAHLEPKAHAYDTIAQIARLSIDSVPPQGAEIDIAWRLKEMVDKLRSKDEERAKVS